MSEPLAETTTSFAEPPPAPPQHLLYPTPLDVFASLLTIIAIALFALTFILQPFRIPSESMERTLLVGDFLLVNKNIYGPPGKWHWLLPYREIQRGDIVVFHFPLDPPEHIVKRVIGVPGDRIHLKDGIVYRNGQPITEPYAVYESANEDAFRDEFPSAPYTDPGVDAHWWRQMRADASGADLIVPAGQYFVMGDNRNHSRDSRYWGFVPRSSVVGRPFIIYFSVREPSTTDLPELPHDRALPRPDDKLGQENDMLSRIVNYARWTRMLRIVR
ncbi:signal peptidase I [Silvibacterium acidisoli]|uniref:signal peptidase I n=1 Tax=Acidobacteriaceae bacterium ZG23-2 TaxID=2883246 RepID=UPI00406C0948